MVTSYHHWVASREGHGARQAGEGLPTKEWNQVRRSFCGIHGHDSMVQFERDRMFLRCSSCGHESPGWALDKTPPIVKARDDARRLVVSRQLVGVRRIA